MNNNDQSLNELFKRELTASAKHAPPFELMWEKAGRSRVTRGTYIWRIAAGVALISTVGIILYLSKPEQDNINGEIAAWKDPTGSLIPSEMSKGTGVLSDWDSPTAFLLAENTFKIQ